MARGSRISIAAMGLMAVLFLCGALPQAQGPLGTAITYQGRLSDAGIPASGSYDLQFTVYDAVTGGAALGTTVTVNAVVVTAGVFTVSPDFGASVFAGSARWLEVRVRPGGSSGAFTTLSPRQALLPAPQSVYAAAAGSATTAGSALTAATATSATQLAGQPPSFYLNLANLTGTLSVAQGGTGATSLAGLQPAPRAGVSLATVDNTFNRGQYSSITIGGDGLGLISYYDNADFGMRVGHCADASCSTLSAPAAKLDSGSGVGFFSSITTGTDGFGLISYSGGSGKVRVVHCANTSCTSATHPPTEVDSGGSSTSITIGSDGLGLISYTGSGSDLKVAHCADTACTSLSAPPTNLDSAGSVGLHTAIAIGADGLGLISYYDSTNGNLKVAHCANQACTSLSELPVALDTVGTVGQYTSIAIGTDGLGIISYYDDTNDDLKVAHCANTACSSLSATSVTVDSGGNVGEYTSIAIGADGLPLIAYRDGTNSDLKVAHCVDIACSTATLATLDGPASVGLYASMTIGADGLALISYLDGTPNVKLKVAHCNNVLCSPFAVRRR